MPPTMLWVITLMRTLLYRQSGWLLLYHFGRAKPLARCSHCVEPLSEHLVRRVALTFGQGLLGLVSSFLTLVVPFD